MDYFLQKGQDNPYSDDVDQMGEAAILRLARHSFQIYGATEIDLNTLARAFARGSDYAIPSQIKPKDKGDSLAFSHFIGAMQKIKRLCPGGMADLINLVVEDYQQEILSSLDAAYLLHGNMLQIFEQIVLRAVYNLAQSEWRKSSLLMVCSQENYEKYGADKEIKDKVQLAYQKIEQKLARFLVKDGLDVQKARELVSLSVILLEGSYVQAQLKKDPAPLLLAIAQITIMIENEKSVHEGE